MFKKILYPTDFSDCAEKVIPYLIELKCAGLEEVVICHIIDDRYTGFVSTASMEDFMPDFRTDFLEIVERRAKEDMMNVEKKLESIPHVRSVIEHGIPVKSLLDVAEKEDVSLIVLGSHGRSNLSEMFLGSVSEKLVRKSSRPCLVIKR